AGERLVDLFPIDQVVPERLEILRTGIAVVDVIGVLPHIAAKDRRETFDQRALAVRRLLDRQFVFLAGKSNPAPARAELPDAGRNEVALRLGDASERALQRFLELGRNLVAPATRLHPLPE